MRQIKEQGPDGIYFGGTAPTGGPEIARDTAKAGAAKVLVVPEGCNEDSFISGAGEETFKKITCCVISGGVPVAEAPGDAAKRYKEKFRAEPEPNAAQGYAAAAVALEAVRKAADTDRDAVRKAALAIKDFPAAIGSISFNGDGDVTPALFSVSVIEGKSARFLKTMTVK